MRPNVALRSRMHGLSLVELMIALTLGLASVAAVGWVYLGTMQTYRTHDSLSRLQEGARHAFELISKDVRMTGATGCSYSSVMNASKTPDAVAFNLFAKPLNSVETTGTAGTETEFSDALTIVRADVSREYVVDAHNSGTSTFTTKADHGLANGQYMVATDCTHASVFQATSAAGKSIVHGSANNASPNLGKPLGSVYTYAQNSRLYRLNSDTYYIGVNDAGVPSLFRDRLNGSGVLETEEVVEGVADLQVTYGVDSTSPADGETDIVSNKPYLTGTEVSAAAALGAAPDRWNRIVSLRISLLMVSADDRVAPEPQKYSFNGVANITPADRRLRKVFTHVIKLRNR